MARTRRTSLRRTDRKPSHMPRGAWAPALAVIIGCVVTALVGRMVSAAIGWPTAGIAPPTAIRAASVDRRG